MENEVLVTHEFNNDLNQRVFLIDTLGNMDILCNEDKKYSFYHFRYYKEYLKRYFLEDANIQSKYNQYQDLNSFIYLLSSTNTVQVIDTSSDGYSSETCYIALPNQISEEQKSALESLTPYLNDFKNITIISDFFVDKNGHIDSKICESLKDNILSYLESYPIYHTKGK